MELMNYLQNLHFTNLIWCIFLPFCFMIGDIITGYIKAVINKNIDSTKMRDGILKKCCELLCILLGYIMNFAFGTNVILFAISIYILLMEITSLLENLKAMGIDLGNITKYFKG